MGKTTNLDGVVSRARNDHIINDLDRVDALCVALECHRALASGKIPGFNSLSSQVRGEKSNGKNKRRTLSHEPE